MFDKKNLCRIAKILATAIGLSLLFVGMAYATDSTTPTGSVGAISETVAKSFTGIGKLMLGTAYVAGIGLAIASIFKFKQHRDNPTQVPIGTPIVLLLVGVCLMFAPAIMKAGGTTVFGDTKQAGGFTGEGATKIIEETK
jgi:intracellular multiplication protein IcmD